MADDDRTSLKKRVGAVVTALVVLGGVAGLAAFTNGRTVSHPAAAATTPAAPVLAPPQVVFTDASNGYAFYADCARVTATDGCPPLLFHTLNGGAVWQPVPLPSFVPSIAAAWGQLQVNGDSVLLSYDTGAFVSDEQGRDWKPLTVVGSTTQMQPTDFVLRQGAQWLLVDPAAGHEEALAPSSRPTAPWEAGILGDGNAWLRDQTSFSVSPDGGKDWVSVPSAMTDLIFVESAMKGPIITDLRLPELTVSTGDGQETLPVAQARSSRNAGKSWTTRQLTGPRLNAPCTVTMGDGTLIGISASSGQILTLPAGKSAVRVATTPPAKVPSCLLANPSMIYGPTSQTAYAYSLDGRTWQSGKLPGAAAAAASPVAQAE